MKKQLILPSFLFFLGIGFLTGSIFLFFLANRSEGKSIQDELVSPLVVESPQSANLNTDLFTQIKKEKTTDKYPPNEYFPANFDPVDHTDLELSAQAFAVMDRKEKTLIMGKNINNEKQIASLTKVATAIVALENEKLDRQIAISKRASEVGEAFMGVSEGEIYTLEDLLYGLLLVSGNDAAEAIADSLGRGRNWFVNVMNQKAYTLGMRDTYFVNPTGLDEDSVQTSSFSSALDLLALTNYALGNDTFAKIVSTKYKEITYKQYIHKGIYLENLISFDRTYPGIKGVKTGNTDFAGQTLISYAQHNAREIIVVLLDSQATRDDAIKIYKWIFEGKREPGN